MKWFLLATETAVSAPGVLGVLASILGAIATTGGAVFAWFKKELEDCKSDRKELFARTEDLHKQVSDLSLRVGRVENPKTFFQP